MSSSKVRPHVWAPLAVAIAPAGELAIPPSAEAEPLIPAAIIPAVDEAELLAIRAAAWEDGYAAGLAEGHQEGCERAAAEQRELTARLAEIVASARVVAEGYTAGLEQRVVELSLAVAKKVIEREAQVDRTMVLQVVRAALEEIQESTTVEVRVHPDDFELLDAQWASFARTPMAQRSQLVVDERVQRGGCIVDMPLGQLDAQLDTKLAQIVETFHALLDGDIG